MHILVKTKSKNLTAAFTFSRSSTAFLAALLLAFAMPPARGATTTSQAWNTPGTYLWSCPTGVTSVMVEVWGGGGGGGGVTNVSGAAHDSNGGGGGAYAKKSNMTVTPGQTYTICIPAVAGGGICTGGSAAANNGTNGAAVGFTNEFGTYVLANGGNGGLGAYNGNAASTVAAGGTASISSGNLQVDLSYAGGNGGLGVSNPGRGGGGSGASDTGPGTSQSTNQVSAVAPAGSDTLHTGGTGAVGRSGNAGTAPGGGGANPAYVTGSTVGHNGGAGGAGQIILTWSGTNAANPAVIASASYSSVSDAAPPNYNLTAIGTQDWQIFGDAYGLYTLQPSELKIYGSSITMQPATYDGLNCNGEQTNSRSAQNYTWTDGYPNQAGTNVDAENNGFIYSNLTAVAYYANYESITFAPGDTNVHVIHLLGYVAGDKNGLSVQFSNSLPGAVSSVFTTNPPLGDFNYSLMFQAQNSDDALTVVWTFAQTNTTGSSTYIGIEAATLSGSPPSAPPPRIVNWRVIPEDPKYPTTDAFVAALQLGETNFGSISLPADTTNQDCSAYFQAAISWMASVGGGTIYVPPGHYKFTNNLSMKSGVTLRGRWVVPGPTQPVTGTIFDIYAGEGTTTTPFLTGGAEGCSLRDLAFWYPHQTNMVSWTPYPWTIYKTMDVENITLVNAYQGIYSGAQDFPITKGVFGTPLMVGGTAFQRAEDLNFSPNYWAWSGLPGAPTNAIAWSALTNALLTNSSCYGMGGGWTVHNCTVSGYYIGFNGNYQNAYGLMATNCTIGAFQGGGVFDAMINCSFSGSQYGYEKTGGYLPNFYGCYFSGGIAALTAAGTPYVPEFVNNCIFNGSVVMQNDAQPLTMNNCSFIANTPTNIILNGIQGEIAAAPNANCGPANCNGGSPPAGVLISTNGLAPFPSVGFSFLTNLMHKPDKLIIFDVTSTNYSQYGAFGDGIHDDTAAIQATINAAETNGGGIVFFPQGQYVVTGNLVVSNGVELRGVNGSRDMQYKIPTVASTLMIKSPPSDPTGTPFLTLGDRCGVWGLVFHYYYGSFANGMQPAFPYTINCCGKSNYLFGCTGSDVFQGVEMNGARGAVMEYCEFGGHSNLLCVCGGATDCTYANCYSQPWAYMYYLPTAPGNGNGLANDSYNSHMFLIEDCTNLEIYTTYTHLAHNLVTVRNGGGSAKLLQMDGEQLQNGYIMESGGGSLTLYGSGANVNGSGDGTGAGSYSFWLQSNYVGTVSDIGFEINPQSANDTVRMDSSQANWFGYGQKVRSGLGVENLRAAGAVSFFGSYLLQCCLDVPAGGNLTVSDSVLDSMSYASQAGLVNLSTNCFPTGNSFVAANLSCVPYLSNGITANTNNLMPIWADGSAWGIVQPLPVADTVAWQLASGSNFMFHVTSPYFTNGIRPNVTIAVSSANVPTNGSLTVSYDTANGLKAMSGLSATVTDARFAATNGVDILLTASNCNPLVKFVAVYATSYLGAAPQLSNPVPPPVATFTCAPTNGIRPLAVTFTDASSGTITNLLWSFGDGQTTNTAAGAVVAHTYTTAGSYTASLKASGPGGSSYTAQAGAVTVLVPNPPQITSIQPVGTSALMLQGTGGPTKGGYSYWLRCSTNLALPLTNWSIVATNPFDLYGNFSNQIPLMPGTPQIFYRLQLP